MTVLNTNYSTIDDAWGIPYLSPSLQQKKKKKKTSSPEKTAANVPQTDPICELYAMGNNHYNEDDIVSFANQYYEKYNKIDWQKPVMRDRDPPKVVDIKDGSVYAYGAPYDYSNAALEPQKNTQTSYEMLNSDTIPAYQQRNERSQSRPAYDDDLPVNNENLYEDGHDDHNDQNSTMDNGFPVSAADSQDQASPRAKYNPRPKNSLVDTHEYYMSFDNPYYSNKNASFNLMDISLYILSGIILIFMMEQFVKVGIILQQS